jgi:hypothetical protein
MRGIKLSLLVVFAAMRASGQAAGDARGGFMEEPFSPQVLRCSQRPRTRRHGFQLTVSLFT